MNAKLDTGRVFERIFTIYREQFTLLIPAALVLFVPVAILNGILLGVGGAVAALATFPIALIATYWYQGLVVEAVVDILDGRRDHTVGSLFSSVSPFIGRLIGAGIAATIIVIIGFILIIVPGLIALTLLALVAPAVVIDRAGVADALQRSRELVRGNAWRVFGVLVVLFLLTGVVTSIINAIGGSVSDDSFAGYAIADLIGRALLAPLSAIAATVMYVELRRVKGEPLAEDTTAGAPPPPDPMVPPPAPPEAPAV
ncbi:MAG: hypothetical protein QOD71_6 [Thermoleophilaceae bacterium]|jgi:hypothetical protein|nr:hypothetical protein [Thermoleophilaceae bacterium]